MSSCAGVKTEMQIECLAVALRPIQPQVETSVPELVGIGLDFETLSAGQRAGQRGRKIRRRRLLRRRRGIHSTDGRVNAGGVVLPLTGGKRQISGSAIRWSNSSTADFSGGGDGTTFGILDAAAGGGESRSQSENSGAWVWRSAQTAPARTPRSPSHNRRVNTRSSRAVSPENSPDGIKKRFARQGLDAFPVRRVRIIGKDYLRESIRPCVSSGCIVAVRHCLIRPEFAAPPSIARSGAGATVNPLPTGPG